jgi:Flp pilus assembly protein TadG
LSGIARRSLNAGVAAVEFALLSPFLVLLMVGIGDFSFAYRGQTELASALAAGARYAFTQGQTESGSTLTTDVTNFVTKISAVPLSSVTTSYNNNDPTNCYCVSGSPATFTAAACGSNCSTAAGGATAGQYVSISGSFSYTALFPLDQVFFGNPYTQAVTARLK